MTAQTVVRNSDVLFETTFDDTADLPITPSSVLLRVTYNAQGEAVTEEVAMANQSGTWKGIWKSNKADAGIVQWFILADGDNEAADQGFFSIIANSPNPQTIDE